MAHEAALKELRRAQGELVMGVALAVLIVVLQFALFVVQVAFRSSGGNGNLTGSGIPGIVLFASCCFALWRVRRARRLIEASNPDRP